MPSSPAVQLSTQQHAALETLVASLEGVFGARLHSVVAYEGENEGEDSAVRTLALVERLTFDDLHQLSSPGRRWQQRGLAVPLLLTHHEFARTLDVFPLEYGNIIANHVLVAGRDPFEGIRVSEADRRRGCEVEAKSHVIHLREGFLETEGDSRRVARLIAASAPAFRTVLLNIVRLERGSGWTTGGGADPRLHDEALARAAGEITGVPAPLVVEVLASPAASSMAADPAALLARYMEASERIWRHVDGWRG
jgi:hypothetical protein